MVAARGHMMATGRTTTVFAITPSSHRSAASSSTIKAVPAGLTSLLREY